VKLHRLLMLSAHCGRHPCLPPDADRLPGSRDPALALEGHETLQKPEMPAGTESPRARLWCCRAWPLFCRTWGGTIRFPSKGG
jgi:hypothetical protein